MTVERRRVMHNTVSDNAPLRVPDERGVDAFLALPVPPSEPYTIRRAHARTPTRGARRPSACSPSCAFVQILIVNHTPEYSCAVSCTAVYS